MADDRLFVRLLVFVILLVIPSITSAQSISFPSELRDQQEIGSPQENAAPQGVGQSTTAGVSFPIFLKQIGEDQQQFWKSPLSLRRPQALKTFLPWAGFTSLLIANDVGISRRVPTSLVGRSRDVSQLGTFALAGGAAALYGIGKLTHNDHARETGFLSGEAALNSLLITSTLQVPTRRRRPSENGAGSGFFQGGDSFPSQHAAVAWSVASTVAHEYPGPLTKLVAYGLASAVTVTRVTGKQHYSSDALVGSVLGWYVGRQVYRHRRNPERDAVGWEEPIQDDDTESEPRPPSKMGSPYVALDSWIYPAIERLAAFGTVQTAFLGLKPWTRMECAQLVEGAGEALEDNSPDAAGLVDLKSALQQEFGYELGLLEGSGGNRTIRFESAYARVISVSGPPLTDGDHLGQTLADDFGRPFRRGANAQIGVSVRAALGPAALYLRAEVQHAPAAPALSDVVRTFISNADLVNAPAAAPFSPVNRPRLLDAYVAVNLREGWQLSFGKQSLFWAPGPGESYLWSNNIEPAPMLRLTQSEMHLPGFLRYLGPARSESFFGRLDGHAQIPDPFIYGNKINFKPLPNLELGFGRTCQIGGHGGDPLTLKNFFLSVFGQVNTKLNSVPGDSNSSFDWVFNVPRTRNYLVFYGELYADDDFLPFLNPPKNPYRPGIYLTRFPHLAKLDFHLEAASTESPGQRDHHGNLNYWNYKYRDGYTNNGNLIGNTVGRMGRSIQCWSNYWFSPRNVLQFTYKHSTVSREFVSGGGAWQDYSLQHSMTFRSGAYAKSRLQYEHISRYPLLFSGPKSNFSVVLEVGILSLRGH